MRARTILALVLGVLVGAVITLSRPAPGERAATTPAPPSVEQVTAQTLLAWTPQRLPDGFARAVSRLPGVVTTVEVRSHEAWLDAWTSASGSTTVAPSGSRIPIEVAAVDPNAYLRFVAPADAPVFGALAGGDVLLGAAAARLRGIGAGGSLRFGSRTLRVAGVVPDTSIGAHEAIVSTSTGSALGVGRPRYLLVASRPDASTLTLAGSIRTLAPTGVRVRVREPGETPAFRHGDAVLPPVAIKELFGEWAAVPASDGALRIDPSWVRANIVTSRVPVLGDVRCHRAMTAQLDAALQEIVRRGLDDLIDPGDYAGCFSPRFLGQDAGAGISHHAWGIAFDINASANPFGAEPHLDRRLVEVFERWGFTWGGRWLVPDAMHFEFVRFPLAPKG